MMSAVFTLITGCLLLAALFRHAWAGFRHGDRASDARVGAVLRFAGQPGEDRPVVVATVGNPSGSPVLAGLAVRPGRRLAGLDGLTGLAGLAGAMNISVPRRTARRRFRPSGFPTVGVVPAWSSESFAVPVTVVARRYRLTVVIGQAEDRLRVHTLRLDAAPPVRVPRLEPASPADRGL